MPTPPIKSELKIPFGLHKETGEYLDAASVPNGIACNCKCDKCGADLQAVHPTFRQKHFRHHTKTKCDGALESLFHKVAKQILKENNSIKITSSQSFAYQECDIEKRRHGKQPDAFLSDGNETLIVEIYFSHRIEDSSIYVYFGQNERILEIDISKLRGSLFNYELLKEMILDSAPRTLIKKTERSIQKEDTSSNIWWLALFAGILFFFWWLFKKAKRKPRIYRRR